MAKPRLLIFVVAYHAEATIEGVLSRIPASLEEEYETQVLVIDDASTDRTFERSRLTGSRSTLAFPVRVLFNPVNQGYGGNQKIGYHYAIKHRFDYVALLHGDGQYAPERLPDLVRPLKLGEADACFGSRMLTRGAARSGGMPVYKFLGNRVLTRLENWILHTDLSEFHSGYRAYSVRALAGLPFDRNTNGFHFDTEIIVQFVLAKLRIVERPIPTYYGDEICRVNGLKYARDVVLAVVRARAQQLGLLYDRRFDCVPEDGPPEQYQAKLDFDSPHRFALRAIRPGSRVLDLGCAGGRVAAAIRQNGNYVVGVDERELDPAVSLDEFCRHDLNRGLPAVAFGTFDYILLLDVIEHLTRPERMVAELRRLCDARPNTTIIASTANIGFFVTRVMLLLGQFNYGKRGILDLTHTRLFTFASFRRLFEQQGFRISAVHGVPAPFPLAIKRARLSRFLLRLNSLLIRIARGLCSYQIVMVVEPYPSLDLLLEDAQERSDREPIPA